MVFEASVKRCNFKAKITRNQETMVSVRLYKCRVTRVDWGLAQRTTCILNDRRDENASCFPSVCA